MKAVSIKVPSDKSISHRAVMLASVSKGTTHIKNLLIAEDIKRTIEAFRAMGVEIRGNGVNIAVRGVGMAGLKKPSGPLYLGNSGTTMRVLPGILAGQDFEVILKGDASLSKRPMTRIAEPLRKMGAEIASDAPRPRNDPFSVIASEAKQSHEIHPPLKIHGGKLKAIKYKSKIASAQVKSCILLAGLYADGVTSVSEPEKSRDHTERMLEMFGCRVKSNRRAGLNLPYGIVRARPKAESRTISLKGPAELKSPGAIEIPGDISSAAFFIVAGCILPDIKIVLKNVGLNPTRTGVIDILKRMGADIEIVFCMSLRAKRSNLKKRDCFAMTNYTYEPYGDIIARPSKLKGVTISSKEVIRAIDEIPVIMVSACFAKGKTVIKGIKELRVKETDRVYSMVTNLRKLGADIRINGETIIINGARPLHGAKVSSFGDHRTAMSMLVAGLGTKGKVIVTGLDCINKSFPGFERLLRRLPLAGPSQ